MGLPLPEIEIPLRRDLCLQPDAQATIVEIPEMDPHNMPTDAKSKEIELEAEVEEHTVLSPLNLPRMILQIWSLPQNAISLPMHSREFPQFTKEPMVSNIGFIGLLIQVRPAICPLTSLTLLGLNLTEPK
jgi:hypothetical protein